jgi:hypothetical protein
VVPEEDEHQDAIVTAGLTELPLLGEADRDVLEAFALERLEDRDDDLVTAPPLLGRGPAF